jgi:hypothetical protein
MTRKILVAVLLICASMAAGCHTTYVTVEENKNTESVLVSYKFGMLEAILAKDVPTLTAASDKALTDLRMPVVSKSSDKLVGKVTAYTSDGKDVTVSMASIGENITKMNIVVGSRWDGGDEVRSRLIFQKILESGGWGQSPR